MTNLELTLTHYREAARIFMAINYVDNANGTLHNVAFIEETIRTITAAVAATKT